MASFTAAYDILAPNEGGYRNVPYDRGGETYRGIARNYHPGWSGWAFIDAYKAQHGNIPAGTIFPELEPEVMGFVQEIYWTKVHGDGIVNQQLANMVLDFCYQSSYGPREINNALGLGSTNAITADTLQALNADPVGAFDKIRAARIQYYQDLNREGLVSDNDIEGILARVRRLAAPGIVAVAGIGTILVGAALFFC